MNIFFDLNFNVNNKNLNLCNFNFNQKKIDIIEKIHFFIKNIKK